MIEYLADGSILLIITHEDVYNNENCFNFDLCFINDVLPKHV